jgi:hypothetical protein
MRIGIDIRYLSHGLLGGVHTYLANLLPALFEAGSREQFILYADRKAPLEVTPPCGVVVRTLPWRSALSTILNDWSLARRMAEDHVDVAFYPTNYGFGPPQAGTVVMVHDAINLLPLSDTLRSPGRSHGMRSDAMTVYLHYMTTRAVARANVILTASEYSRTAIAAASGRPIEDIIAVPHGAAPIVPVMPAELHEVLSRHALRSPYLLADGLKNPGVLLSAWERLEPAQRRGCALVFFARSADVLPVLHDAVARGFARLLVRPSLSDLAALYAGAAAFVFPSWLEGFGIPLLEAMSHGTPIVASDRGSIPEVVGDAALLVDAEDAAALASALARILTSDTESVRLRALGCARVAQFTWRRTAEMTLEGLGKARAQKNIRSQSQGT